MTRTNIQVGVNYNQTGWHSILPRKWPSQSFTGKLIQVIYSDIFRFFFFFKTISVYYNKLENAVGGWDPFWSKAHFRWIGFRELLDPKWLETFGEMTLLSAILKDSGAESICKVSLTFRLSYSMHRIELYLYYSSWMNQTLQWENILSPGLFQCQILRGD